MAKRASISTLENEFLRLQLKEVAGGWLTQSILAKRKSSKKETLALVGEKPNLGCVVEEVTVKQGKISSIKMAKRLPTLGEPKIVVG